MKVKLKTMMASAKGSYAPGAILSTRDGIFSVEELQSFVDGNYATSIEPEKQGYETAVAPKTPEEATISVSNEENTPSNKAEKPVGKLRMKKVGGGFYDILDENGKVVNGNPLKKDEAQAFLKGK